MLSGKMPRQMYVCVLKEWHFHSLFITCHQNYNQSTINQYFVHACLPSLSHHYCQGHTSRTERISSCCCALSQQWWKRSALCLWQWREDKRGVLKMGQKGCPRSATEKREALWCVFHKRIIILSGSYCSNPELQWGPLFVFWYGQKKLMQSLSCNPKRS